MFLFAYFFFMLKIHFLHFVFLGCGCSFWPILIIVFLFVLNLHQNWKPFFNSCSLFQTKEIKFFWSHFAWRYSSQKISLHLWSLFSYFYTSSLFILFLISCFLYFWIKTLSLIVFAVFRKEKKICDEFETISLGFNNIDEFTSCFKGMQCAKLMTNKIEVVGDCIILIKAVPKTHAIKNYALNELLCEIWKLAMCFDEIEFTHVPWELNKQADAIVTAASWSKEDGTCAVIDHYWDPKSQHVAETSKEWIILNSTLWNWITSPLTYNWIFPIPPGNVVPPCFVSSPNCSWKCFNPPCNNY